MGSGIAGLSAAWLLKNRYQVDLYEQNDYVGGHTHTIEVLGREWHDSKLTQVSLSTTNPTTPCLQRCWITSMLKPKTLICRLPFQSIPALWNMPVTT